MFRIWLNQALKCKSKTQKLRNILIITESLSERILDFIKNKNNPEVKIIYGNYYSGTKRTDDNYRKVLNCPSKWNHNVYFKLFNLCELKEPYIYIDADAIIMSDLNESIKYSYDKPFICIDHQTIPGHTSHLNYKFMNTGVMFVSEPKFMNFEKIYRMRYVYIYNGTDQMMMNNYCKLIHYDYTHTKIHYGYNSCAAFVKEECNKIVSDGIPEKHEVYVLHYWYHYKPWTKCSCCVRGNQECIFYNQLLKEL